MSTKKWLIIVDYQNTFSDVNYKWSARELYVEHSESLAEPINQLIDKTKQEWWIVLASREIHSVWHMFFASSYKNKMPIIRASTIDISKWLLTSKEIEHWTEEENGLTALAKFSVEELKEVLRINGWEIILWPNHCEKETRWTEYHPMLNSGLIDREVIKWQRVDEHPYSAFWWIDVSGKKLIEVFEEYDLNEWDVVWVATDYCVPATVLEWLWFKLKMNLILSGCAGVYPLWTYEAIKNMEKQWASILQ